MDTLKALQVFVEVSRQGGFANAGKALGLSPSSVSRHVVNLEDMLGAQLFHRTTRSLSLTPAGEDVLGQCQGIVREFDALVKTGRRERAQPEGRFRVTMPVFVGAILMEDVVAGFVRDFPQVDLDLLLVDRVLNLVEEGFDLAVRVGRLQDSTLITRKFLDLNLALVASPEYLERNGPVLKPADLAAHNCIIDSAAPYRDRWPFIHKKTTRRHKVRGNVSVNSGAAARDLAVGGVGLTLLPEYHVFEEVAQGRLVTVLDDHMINYGGIFIVYPKSRHLSVTVRRFADLLIAQSKPISAYRDRVKSPQSPTETMSRHN